MGGYPQAMYEALTWEDIHRWVEHHVAPQYQRLNRKWFSVKILSENKFKIVVV